jgi:energy-coupling factor transporter ATP-binding protein EcfA2
MYVNNVRIYAKHLRRDLAAGSDGLARPAHQRLLLQGPNGSGKTTFLYCIAKLWQLFGDLIDAGAGRNIPSALVKNDYVKSDLVAAEFRDLLPEGRSLWMGAGHVGDWVQLKDEHPDAAFAGLIQIRAGVWEIQLPEGDWTTFRQRSLVGAEPHPNVVYFPPENRTVPLISKSAPQIVDLTALAWSPMYTTSKVDLPSLLLTTRARNPAYFEQAIRLINSALDNQGKRLIPDFGPHGMMIEILSSGYQHAIGALSSGEKQLLLLVGFVAATLRPGGVLVIDEPDLHIHITLVQQLLGSLEAVVRERSGQFIVAAHSTEVWKWFSLDSERVELGKWQGER